MSAFAGVEDLAPPSVEESASSYAEPAELPSVDQLQARADAGEEEHTPPPPREVGLDTSDGASADADAPPDPAVAFGTA